MVPSDYMAHRPREQRKTNSKLTVQIDGPNGFSPAKNEVVSNQVSVISDGQHTLESQGGYNQQPRKEKVSRSQLAVNNNSNAWLTVKAQALQLKENRDKPNKQCAHAAP